jgi:hypothetical protein
MDLKFEDDGSFTNDDKSWLASRMGIDTARSITLDLSLFTSGTHYPNGFIPSGVTLGKVTATGRYGPYNNALATGQEVNAGHLLSAVEVRSTNTTGRAAAALFWNGIVREARLPANHGLDAAGKTDVAAHIRYE